jgi:uncharacterized coiled-coil protein SlyX
MKDKEWSGLMKIPDEVVIRELRIRLGQQEAYIAELEDKLKEKEYKAVKQTKLEHLENLNANLTAKIADAQNRLGDLGLRNKRLEAELLQLLKQSQK